MHGQTLEETLADSIRQRVGCHIATDMGAHFFLTIPTMDAPSFLGQHTYWMLRELTGVHRFGATVGIGSLTVQFFACTESWPLCSWFPDWCYYSLVFIFWVFADLLNLVTHLSVLRLRRILATLFMVLRLMLRVSCRRSSSILDCASA